MLKFSDIQRIFLTSQAFIRHEIQCLTYLTQTINDNIEKLMKDKQTPIPTEDGDANMDILFPINNEDDLQIFEAKIKDLKFRTSLVNIIYYIYSLYYYLLL